MSRAMDWVTVAMIAGFLVGSFRGWRVDPRWWMKAVFAFFGLGFLVITPLMAWHVAGGYRFNIASKDWPVLIFATATTWAGVIYWLLQPAPAQSDSGQAPPKRWGCLRTILSMIGCLVVGYAMFAILVFGIAGAIGLAGYLS